MTLIYIIILGIQRINKTHILQYNGVFQKIIGLKKFPNASTIRRFLHRLPPKVIRQIVKVHFMLQMKLFSYPHPKESVTFDIDPTAITVYGKQQRAKVGYNPKKRGRRCYSLMLCFEDSNQEFWQGSLYSGNVSPVKVAPHFIKGCLDKLPSTVKNVRIRFDSGFYSHKLVEWLENTEKSMKIRIFFTIESQIRNPMLAKMQSIKYKIFKKDWEESEFLYQPQGWRQPYRFIVIRRPLPENPEEARQLSLFELKGYGYRVIVTNLSMKPKNIWKFHCQRAKGAELNIRELKNSYHMINLPTKGYTANIAYCQILMFGYNIISWFKRLYLPKEFRYATLQTIREKILVLPGRLIETNHKNVLKLPADYIHQELFKNILSKIEKLKF